MLAKKLKLTLCMLPHRYRLTLIFWVLSILLILSSYLIGEPLPKSGCSTLLVINCIITSFSFLGTYSIVSKEINKEVNS